MLQEALANFISWDGGEEEVPGEWDSARTFERSNENLT